MTPNEHPLGICRVAPWRGVAFFDGHDLVDQRRTLGRGAVAVPHRRGNPPKVGVGRGVARGTVAPPYGGQDGTCPARCFGGLAHWLPEQECVEELMAQEELVQ